MDFIQEPSSLKEAIQSIIPEAMGLIQGKVISENPLKIQVVNDSKFTLNGNNLCIPRSLTNYKVKIEDEDVTVYNTLQVGDIVYLLSFNHGKKYYVLGRI